MNELKGHIVDVEDQWIGVCSVAKLGLACLVWCSFGSFISFRRGKFLQWNNCVLKCCRGSDTVDSRGPNEKNNEMASDKSKRRQSSTFKQQYFYIMADLAPQERLVSSRWKLKCNDMPIIYCFRHSYSVINYLWTVAILLLLITCTWNDDKWSFSYSECVQKIMWTEKHWSPKSRDQLESMWILSVCSHAWEYSCLLLAGYFPALTLGLLSQLRWEPGLWDHPLCAEVWRPEPADSHSRLQHTHHQGLQVRRLWSNHVYILIMNAFIRTRPSYQSCISTMNEIWFWIDT